MAQRSSRPGPPRPRRVSDREAEQEQGADPGHHGEAAEARGKVAADPEGAQEEEP
jgi:hypothetical protein